MNERSTPFAIRYRGDATPGTLEAQELLRLLSAFTRISMRASATLYGSDVRTSFRISHVQSGSIDIQGFVEILAGLQPAFPFFAAASFGVSDIPSLIKEWLDILKFLKGQPAKNVLEVQSGNAVQIENNSGDVQVVNGNVYNTVILNDVGKQASKLQEPFKRGAGALSVVRGDEPIATYAQGEVESFRSVRPPGESIESEIDAILEVVSPVLEGEGLWRFRYGRMIMTAKLIDEHYRQKVEDGTESFRHGDRLKVRLKTIQSRSGRKVDTKHMVTEVVARA